MNPFYIACFVVAYIGYLFIQSFIINGIKSSADGVTKILPDGSEQDSAMILYPMQKYLLQHKMRKVFYSGSEFEKIWEMYKHKYINIIPASVSVIDNEKLTTPNEEDIEVMKKLCYVIERDHEVKWDYDGTYFSFYKEFPDFKFSKYIRMPIIQCIKCMSSFWSTFVTFVPVMIYVFGFHWWLIPFWILNIFALTYINKILYRPDVIEAAPVVSSKSKKS